jgi:hypothetical protein
MQMSCLPAEQQQKTNPNRSSHFSPFARLLYSQGTPHPAKREIRITAISLCPHFAQLNALSITRAQAGENLKARE